MGDPTGGWSATGRSPGLLLRSQMGRFETKWLAGLRTSPLSPICPDGGSTRCIASRRPPRIVVLDMDSSESPTYGEQEGAAYNGDGDKRRLR